jgi:hypothetical protein
MAEYSGTLDFATGQSAAYATVTTATTITSAQVIQPFFTSNLDEVAVLDMRISESSRSAGSNMVIIGYAPDGAWGAYSFRVIVTG